MQQKIKICLVYDNETDDELLFKISSLKEQEKLTCFYINRYRPIILQM